MNPTEENVLDKFKSLLLERVRVHKMILFGSRARGDAGPYSDMDVVVILDNLSDERDFDYVSDCAWEAGFEHGIVIVPVIFLPRRNGRTVLNGLHCLHRQWRLKVCLYERRRDQKSYKIPTRTG